MFRFEHPDANTTFVSQRPAGFTTVIPRWLVVLVAFVMSLDGLTALAAPASAAPLGPASVTISNIPVLNGVVGQTFTPTFSGGYTGTASVASSTTSVCTVAAGVVSYVASGTCTLTASATDPLTGVAQSITVGTKKVSDGPNGEVKAIAQDSNGVRYMGGTFTGWQPQTGGGALLSDASSSVTDVDRTFAGVVGSVNATVPDGSGGWFIGGSFTAVGGVVRNNLAHLLANGNVDSAWDPNVAGGAVNAVALSGSTV